MRFSGSEAYTQDFISQQQADGPLHPLPVGRSSALTVPSATRMRKKPKHSFFHSVMQDMEPDYAGIADGRRRKLYGVSQRKIERV